MAAARAQMRAMINRVKPIPEPYWKTQIGAILGIGSFKRAMWVVPKQQAQALWAEFESHMDPLTAIRDAARGFPPWRRPTNRNLFRTDRKAANTPRSTPAIY